MRWFYRLAGDFSVGVKLLLGFGIVLLMTIGVAITAFRSFNIIQNNSDNMMSATQIQASILSARIAEKEFAVSIAPSASAEVQKTVQEISDEIASGSKIGAPVELRNSIQQYLRQFLRFSDSLKVAREARRRMQNMANIAAESFTTLQLDELDNLTAQAEKNIPPGRDQLILFEQVVGLRDKLAKLRGYEAHYSQSGEESVRNDWEIIMIDLLTGIQSLTLGTQAQNSKQAAHNALLDYRKAFNAFVESRKNIAQSNAAMNAEAHKMSELLAVNNRQQALSMQAEQIGAYRQLAIITALALTLGMGAAWLIRQMIVRPLRQTVILAQCVAAGDLSHYREHGRRQDELGQLLDTVHTMLDGLRGLVGRIGIGVERLNDTAHSLDEVIQRSSLEVVKQQQETEIAATSMRQMSASAHEVARNVTEARAAVTQADQLAREGEGLVRQAHTKIDLLAAEMATCSNAMQCLLTESASIHGVLDVIKSIADQTNLLALNAAIEAARAGEHGRGFAVVADEVRGLARRTQSSTAEVAGLLERLREVVQHASTRLDVSSALTEETVVLAGETSKALGRITRAVLTIEEMNQQIALASEQQSLVTEGVSQSMERVREVAENRKEESAQLLTSTADLQFVGNELNAAVGHFRT